MEINTWVRSGLGVTVIEDRDGPPKINKIFRTQLPTEGHGFNYRVGLKAPLTADTSLHGMGGLVLKFSSLRQEQS